MGKRFHASLFIFCIAIAVAFAALPFILEARGMKVSLGVWYFLEILAVLMIVGALVWAYWEKVEVVYLRVSLIVRQVYWKSRHIGYKRCCYTFPP